MTPEGWPPHPARTHTRLSFSITRQLAKPFSFARKIPFGHLFPLGSQSESSLNGTLTGHQTKYSENYSKCKKRWKDGYRRDACSLLPAMTGTANQTHLILSVSFVVFRMKMKTSSSPPSPTFKLAQVFQKGQNSAFAFGAECFLSISFSARIPLLLGGR